MSDYFDEVDILASVCRSSFEEFCREFWETIPGAGKCVWNWHMTLICETLQDMAERVFRNEPRLCDYVLNVSPGTSKSSLVSILFPAWVWTRMPQARIISSSHTDMLVLDHAIKSRYVIHSDKYRECFPDIELRSDQAAKSLYGNTLGGDRLSCTVAGKSPMGFHAHFILCLPYESRILTDRGELPIGEIVENELPVKVLGFDHQTDSVCWKDIIKYESSEGRPLCRINFSDGTSLEATHEHPVYVVGRGYVHAEDVTQGDEVLNAVQLCSLWERGKSLSGACCSAERQDLLQQRVQCSCSYGGGASQIQSDQDQLQKVWQGSRGSCRSEGYGSLLQQRVLYVRPAWGESLSLCGEDKGSLYLQQVRERTRNISKRRREKEILLSGLCKQRPCFEDARGAESKLGGWKWKTSVSAGVLQNQTEGHEEGQASLCHVQQERRGVRKLSACASHRLEQEEQPAQQPSNDVYQMPYGYAGACTQKREICTKVVTSVERAVRIPDKVYNLEIEDTHNYFAEGVLLHNCDDPIDPKKAISEAELEIAKQFFDAVIPSRKVNKEVTATFLLMQRLHQSDPTGYLLEKAKREGAATIQHICLPAELEKNPDGTWNTSNVKPVELAANYVDGLMDPLRLNRKVLKERRADGVLAFSGQYMQSPTPLGGGMFKDEFFLQVEAASPYRALRVRAWDRAASDSSIEYACYTAGVLMSRDDQDWYHVEHCIHGRWEPFERNDRIVACAIADRARYGPNYEPIIYIERERGSTGEESFRHLARRLAGFRVKEFAPSGAKEVRAEPWSDQLAAKNVKFVLDNSWDFNNYRGEHLLFPRGKYKDQVDASAMAFTILAEMKRKIGFRSLTFGRKTKGVFKLIILTREELPSTVITDHPAILISITNPEPISKLDIPESGITNLMGKTVIKFADADPAHYQERWNEVLPAYGRTIQEVIMNQDTGKQLWKFLTGRYPTNPECVLFMDDGNGDARATSLAYAVCDVMGLKRKDTVYRISDGESMNTHQGPAPNNHVYAMVKATRGMIL